MNRFDARARLFMSHMEEPVMLRHREETLVHSPRRHARGSGGSASALDGTRGGLGAEMPPPPFAPADGR